MNDIQRKVMNDEIHWMCFDCGLLYRDPTAPSYNGTYTVYNGTCEVCHKDKAVTTARKLIGVYKFI